MIYDESEYTERINWQDSSSIEIQKGWKGRTVVGVILLYKEVQE